MGVCTEIFVTKALFAIHHERQIADAYDFTRNLEITPPRDEPDIWQFKASGNRIGTDVQRITSHFGQ